MVSKILISSGQYVLCDSQYAPMLKTLGHWCLQSKKYAATRHRGKLILMHNLIAEWAGWEIPAGMTLDHKNRNGLDNRLKNLRLATASQQNANTEKSSRNTSGFKGVFWHKRAHKWMVQLKYQHQYYYLGLFTSKSDAARAYSLKLQELAGEFAHA